jgi:hypothetical protein
MCGCARRRRQRHDREVKGDFFIVSPDIVLCVPDLQSGCHYRSVNLSIAFQCLLLTTTAAGTSFFGARAMMLAIPALI